MQLQQETLQEAEFLAENNLVDIIPNFIGDKLKFICVLSPTFTHSTGRFRPLQTRQTYQRPSLARPLPEEAEQVQCGAAGVAVAGGVGGEARRGESEP